MTLILCVDSRGGLLFHGRRQSQDRLLRQDLLEERNGERLWVTPYTARQFQEQDALSIAEDPLSQLEGGDFCWIEDLPVQPYLERADRLLLYSWNRVYPTDCSIPLPPGPPWSLLRQEEFPGFSHDLITKEWYTR